MPLALPRMRSLLRSAARPFIETFNELFPPVVRSAVSTAEADGWEIDRPDRYCRRCGASVGPGEATPRGCSHCVGEPVAWSSITRLSLYTEPVSQWIIAMKFHKEWAWATWFGERLAEIVPPPADPNKTLVCHLPMPWVRRWRRGYSQAQLMAAAFAKKLSLPHAPILRRVGWQSPQTSVHASQRHDNVRHAFRIEPVDLTGWDVWLLDDVKTSGASLTPCVRLLRHAGAENVHVAVAAVADPKNAEFKLK